MKRSSAPYGVLAAATVAICSGCYSYVPTELTAVPVGEEVRVFLTRDAFLRIRDQDDQGLDDSGAPQVRGTLVRRDQAGIAVLIPIANRQVGFLQSPIGRQVTVAPEGVVQIEERTLSKGRTALTLGAGAALVGTVIFFVLDDARQPTPTPGVPGDDAIRIPLLSLPTR